ncbi:MAG: nickel-responsive transcriptional regulator NikR [Campylobacterales bacterium]
MDKTIRFCVSLQETLLEELDTKVTNRGYSSRSELVRDLIREKLVDDSWSGGKEEVVGVLTLIYDHHQRELSQKMIELQHQKYLDILCNTHMHIDHHNCLETIIIKGDAQTIENLSIQIGGLKGVKFSKLTRASAF